MIPSHTRNRISGGAVLLALCAMPFTTIVYGATLAKLWEWFVADTFGVRSLSVVEAIGISLVVEFVTYQHDARHEPDGVSVETVVGLIVASLVRCLLTLMFALILVACL